MKLIIAIVQDEDANRLISELMNGGFRVTKLASTGGFLRAGNTTLLIGVEDAQLDACLKVVEKVSHSRRQLAAAPSPVGGGASSFTSFPIEVTVGGATVFVLSVEQFIKI